MEPASLVVTAGRDRHLDASVTLYHCAPYPAHSLLYPLRRSIRSRFICARRARFSAFAFASRRCSDGGV
ncbi:MAG TPA: hypothetical protein VF221_03645 [Chloroflexota bacterium]